MSLEANMKESDYDQDLLAEKYIRIVGLSHDDFTNKRLVVANFFADNVMRLIKRGLSYINYNIPVECAIDIGCGQGHLCRVLIQENIAEYVVGIDKSKEMIKSAKANSADDNTQYKYIVANVATDGLLTILSKKCPLIVQVHMLCHAEDIDQLSQILSNIAQVSCGVFVGLIPNPYCDYTSDSVKKLLKYGVKYTMNETEQSMKDGIKYQVTFEQRTSNETSLVDHWYSPETYERVFKQAGFRLFEWIPLQLDRNKDNAYLIDLVDSNSLIGFIATMT
jgi:SAM-dependent methyltransferase